MELYITQRQVMKHLDLNEYIALKTLCRYSKDMYNMALYNVRQHYFNTKQYLSYNSNKNPTGKPVGMSNEGGTRVKYEYSRNFNGSSFACLLLLYVVCSGMGCFTSNSYV